MLQAKGAFIEHQKKEDNELYPTLYKVGRNNKDFQRKVEPFGKVMEEITKFALQFFDEIEKEEYIQLEYSKDFGKLMTLLINRISREEHILYPLYESFL